MEETRSTDSPPARIPDPPAPRTRTVLLCAAVLFGGVRLSGWLEDSGARAYRAVLQAHSTALCADRAATIQEIVAAEGTSVEEGEPVMVLADVRLASDLEAARQNVESRKGGLAKAEAKAEMELAWRMKEINAEILETRLKSADFLRRKFDREMEQTAWNDVFSESNTALRSTDLESVFRPVSHSAATGDRLQVEALLRRSSALNAAEVSLVQIRLCDERLAELEELKRSLPEKVRQAAGVEEARLQYESALKELAELEARPREFTLQAPRFGTVGVYRKAAGEPVTAGEKIVEILDDQRRYLVVQLPSAELATVTAGDEVTLLFPGHEERHGVLGAIPPQAEGESGRIPVRITPSGKLWPEAPIGSTVEVVLVR